MAADFSGTTAQLYARYRRDLPGDQAAALADLLGLRPDDVVVDLGCGTGQLTAPLRAHCAGVIGVDPEPAMLAGLRERGLPDVACVLGSDADLAELGRLAGTAMGAVVIGNALHWMDEPATLAAAVSLLRPGGGVAVVTQGPPLWLGPAGWQQRVRAVLEGFFGPVSDTCGSDAAAAQARAELLTARGLDVRVAGWTARYPVDADWVVGHLGSALPDGALERDGLVPALRAELADGLVEEVTTTAVVARSGPGDR